MNELGFWKHAADHGDAAAVIEAEGTSHTFADVLGAANQVVHGLRELGLVPGDCIAMALPNSAVVLELFMAVTQAGWYLVPINWHLTAPEIAYILRDSSAKAFVASGRFPEVARAAADEAEVAPSARFALGSIEGFRAYSELKNGRPSGPPAERTAGAPMTYTSGTTGNPKGVRRKLPRVLPEQVYSQQALFLALFGMFPGSSGVHVVGAPLYHTAVLNFATNHLHLGHTLVLMDKWTPEGMLEVIERYRVTSSHMVPTQFNRLLKLPEEVRRRFDVSSLSHVIHSAAPCPIDTKRKMLEWWGPCIYEYYAASEGGGTLATPDDWLKKPGTVGKPWPISQIRIMGDDHEELPPGTVGTVWIKMGDHTFEYHKDPRKTGDAWREGFFTVGDAGYLDADGYLFLVDRKSDMIISGGVNIYPAEIEAVLVSHPKVADIAVFGIPHEDWGEEVKAVIQPAPGSTPGPELEAELRDFASARLAKYKMPKTIDFIEEMPRDPNGKLYKRKLRDPYWQGHKSAIV